MTSSARTTHQAVDPWPFVERVVCPVILIRIIFVRGAGMTIIYRRFSHAWLSVTVDTPRWRTNLNPAVTVGSMAALHLIETPLWAIPISVGGLIPNLRDNYYYVYESHATMGDGNISLPDEWRLVGPIIAMSGLFTFGWTGSPLFKIMVEFRRLDRGQARKDQTNHES